MKWIIIVSLVLCTLFSGVFTYFTKITYSADNSIIVGPQPDAVNDVKFRESIPYTIVDLLKNDKTAPLVAQKTGLDINKDSLYAMISQSVNALYQRVDYTVSAPDENTVRLVSEKYPEVIKTLSKELFGVANLQIQNDTFQIKSTSKPYKRNMIAGAVGGVGVGLVIVFILLLFDDRFKDKQGIKRLYGIDYLGDEKNFSHTKFLLKTYKRSVRSIANLSTDTQDQGQMLEQISRYAGALNKQVLLIDLGNQTLEGKQGLPVPGLTDLLESKESTQSQDFSRYIQPSPNKGVSSLTLGTEKDLPLNALIDGRFHHIMETLKDVYDIVYLNLPPDLGIDKNLLLIESCDGVIMAVRENALTVTGANEIVDNLKSLDVNILGYYIIQ